MTFVLWRVSNNFKTVSYALFVSSYTHLFLHKNSTVESSSDGKKYAHPEITEPRSWNSVCRVFRWSSNYKFKTIFKKYIFYWLVARKTTSILVGYEATFAADTWWSIESIELPMSLCVDSVINVLVTHKLDRCYSKTLQQCFQMR